MGSKVNAGEKGRAGDRQSRQAWLPLSPSVPGLWSLLIYYSTSTISLLIKYLNNERANNINNINAMIIIIYAVTNCQVRAEVWREGCTLKPGVGLGSHGWALEHSAETRRFRG